MTTPVEEKDAVLLALQTLYNINNNNRAEKDGAHAYLETFQKSVS